MCWLLDLFTKCTEALPLKVTDSETLAKILADEVICHYGVSSTLHSDQGTKLTNKVISSLCDSLGITQTIEQRHIIPKEMLKWSNLIVH